MTIPQSLDHFVTLHTASVRANMAENRNCPTFRSISKKKKISNVLVTDKLHTHTHTHDMTSTYDVLCLHIVNNISQTASTISQHGLNTRIPVTEGIRHSSSIILKTTFFRNET